ncbi:cell division protein SepF [Saccharothrix coeruleofusca]|uniref:Cell division protein SepF n=1 Tax=Saccharothrix coeruleofusca TaxID=33919 RepID=A0A918AJQ3_9PSEU|nr:cell division protein SepF [Saccharothrix coeruleofusca]MBP2338351.1 cell division inhibitor SepF [Saccharothrix coeruleofusca]GGP48946.1 cell division protein SepF [Saccharothrix coeruleofusca]
MSGFHKLKAYFGMVPAEYADDPDAYEDERGGRYADYRSDYPEVAEYDGYAEQRNGRRRVLGRSDYRAELDESEDYEPDARTRSRRSWSGDTAVHGALAVDSQREPAARTRPATEPAHPLGRITTLHPRSYNEARTIGEHYRDGTPVIMNLTDMDDADAKRLVDFAAGLAFALRGSIDKVTNKVFLLSPPNIDVTAEDRRRLAEGGFLNHG